MKEISRKTLLRVFFLTLLLCGATFGWTEETKRLRILYLNDFHGYAEPHQPAGSSQPIGGIAALAQEAQRLREGQPILLLAAGDMIQGNQWANFFYGESSIRVMNALGFDALVLGNHEFDFGLEVLQRRLAEAAFPVLGANVEGLSGVRPYLLKEIGGWKVLIIGVVTEDTPWMTHPRNVAGLTFLPPEEALRRIPPEITAQADLVVVLSHLGLPADLRLARQVMDVLPFSNYPVVLRLRGREIREILEHGVSEAGGHGGKFLQVSGLRYVHDPSAPSGSRVREIEIGGRPVELERFYTVATNDFLTAGGDGHAVFRRAFPEQAAHPDWKPEGPDCRVVLYDRSRSIQEMVIHALQKEKKIMAAPEGRIQVQRGGANHADLDK